MEVLSVVGLIFSGEKKHGTMSIRHNSPLETRLAVAPSVMSGMSDGIDGLIAASHIRTRSRDGLVGGQSGQGQNQLGPINKMHHDDGG